MSLQNLVSEQSPKCGKPVLLTKGMKVLEIAVVSAAFCQSGLSFYPDPGQTEILSKEFRGWGWASNRIPHQATPESSTTLCRVITLRNLLFLNTASRGLRSNFHHSYSFNVF